MNHLRPPAVANARHGAALRWFPPGLLLMPFQPAGPRPAAPRCRPASRPPPRPVDTPRRRPRGGPRPGPPRGRQTGPLRRASRPQAVRAELTAPIQPTPTWSVAQKQEMDVTSSTNSPARPAPGKPSAQAAAGAGPGRALAGHGPGAGRQASRKAAAAPARPGHAHRAHRRQPADRPLQPRFLPRFPAQEAQPQRLLREERPRSRGRAGSPAIEVRINPDGSLKKSFTVTRSGDQQPRSPSSSRWSSRPCPSAFPPDIVQLGRSLGLMICIQPTGSAAAASASPGGPGQRLLTPAAGGQLSILGASSLPPAAHAPCLLSPSTRAPAAAAHRLRRPRAPPSPAPAGIPPVPPQPGRVGTRRPRDLAHPARLRPPRLASATGLTASDVTPPSASPTSAETTVLWDRRTSQPSPRPSSGRTAAPSPAATRCAPPATPADPRNAAGWSSTPTSRPPSSPGCSITSPTPAAGPRPASSPSAPSTAGCLAADRRPAARHRPEQRLPHDALRHPPPVLGRRPAGAVRHPRARCCRRSWPAAACSARPTRPCSAHRSPSAASPATSGGHLSARPA